MNHTTEIFLGLFVIFIAAQVGAEVSQRLKLPAVVGEIAAGCIIGPYALNWVKMNAPLEVLAELGAVLLLFAVGLETRIGDISKVGKTALLVGVLGVIVPFILGVLWAVLSGFSTPKAMFVAAAFVATSAGITARVLQEMKVLGRQESRIILGAAVIDDILAMLLLGVVTSLQAGKGVNFFSVGVSLLQAVGFVVVIALVGTRFMRRGSGLLELPISPISPLMLTLALCLGLATAASHLGLAAIIGAFLAGMVAAESQQRFALEKQVQPILAFLAPFFFVTTGMKVDLTQLGNLNIIGVILLVTLLASLGKLLGCGAAALPLGKKSALIIGIGMIPRGEVGIIIASLGQKLNVFPSQTYSVIIAMSLLTSIIAPPVLKQLMADLPKETSTEAEDSLLIQVEETGHDSPISEQSKPIVPPVEPREEAPSEIEPENISSTKN